MAHEHEHEEERTKKDYIIFGIRIALTVVLILLGKLWLNEENFPWYVNLIVMLAAFAVIAYDIVIETFEKIFVDHEFFDECSLMLLASAGAFALRAYGPEHNEYLEGVLVMLLYQVGELFEDLAADKSKDSITKAIDLRKEAARVLINGDIQEKPAEEIEAGDMLVCGAGMKVLADGIIVEGEGDVDESSLTGEFNPVHLVAGEKVNSGSVLVSGSIQIRAERAYSDSTVAKLLDMIINSSEKKSKSTRFIDRFSKFYTPIIMGLAVLVAVVPPLFLGIADGGVWARFIYGALSFLVVACPCAIVISVPLAYFAGLGLASKHGILVKGAGYFDVLNDLAYVAMDKTGTLTEGKFSVEAISPIGVDEQTLLEYAAAAECLSTHPIAKAIVEKQSAIKKISCQGQQEVSGHGVKAEYQGKKLLVGKYDFLRNEGVKELMEEEEGTIVYVACDGIFIGFIKLVDKLKNSAKPMVSDLKLRKIKTVLLSGDKQQIVEEAALELGLDQWHGGLLPQDKLSRLDPMKGKGLAFVGDGINDAPSLALADVGIAMGGLGSDVAINNADIVILNDDLTKIPIALDIAKKTKRRAIFNIAFSLIIKGAVMVLSIVAAVMATWSLPLAVAIFADTGLAMLMILSSLLLAFAKPKAKLLS